MQKILVCALCRGAACGEWKIENGKWKVKSFQVCHSEERSDVGISGRQLRFRRGFPVFQACTARLPRLLRSLAMTNLIACFTRRGARANLRVPSSRVIARRAQARRGNLMQALLNGNRNERENGVSLSGGCAASSPKGRAKLRNDKSGSLSHSPGRRDRPGNRINNPDSQHTLHSARYIPCAARPFRP